MTLEVGEMGIIIKSEVRSRANDLGLSSHMISAEILKSIAYWGRSEGEVCVGGLWVRYRKVRRVAEASGRVTRFIVAEAG